MKRIIRIIKVLLIMLFCTTSYALTSDQYLPYYVRATTIIYKNKLHLTIYISNVHAHQGSSQLSGDKVIVYNSANGSDILRMVATGHPAHYSTLPDKQSERLYAQAETIEYYPQKNQVLLLKKARVTQKKNVFTGPHIWYDIKQQKVISTNPKGSSETKIVIEPQHANS